MSTGGARRRAMMPRNTATGIAASTATRGPACTPPDSTPMSAATPAINASPTARSRRTEATTIDAGERVSPGIVGRPTTDAIRSASPPRPPGSKIPPACA